ncbi:hypothetical protein QQP08_000859 [Theobroma cacao]|nr:hypothetical protein QQP08_000859 [Theobroma cacao]
MKKFCFIHMLESAKSCCTLFSDSYHVVQDDGFTLKLVSHWQPKLQSFLSRARFDVVCFPRSSHELYESLLNRRCFYGYESIITDVLLDSFQKIKVVCSMENTNCSISRAEEIKIVVFSNEAFNCLSYFP